MTEPIAKKIKSLLTKAESTEFQEEADAFFAKAAELMARYSISQAEVEAAKRHGDRRVLEIERRTYTVASPYSVDRMHLVSQVSQALGGYAYYMKQPRDGRKTRTKDPDHNTYAFIVGVAEDIDQIEIMLESLNRQMDHAREQAAAGQVFTRGVGGKKVWNATFIRAYSYRIGARLREAYDTVIETEQTESVALVLRDKKEAIIEELSKLGIKQVNSNRQTSTDAIYAGRAAADRANIHRSISQ